VVQDVFLRAWQRRSELERCTSPTGWLLVTATRLSLDRLRKRKTAARLAPIASEPPATPPGQLELARMLLRLLAQEDLLRQQIVLHSWLDGMTQEEVAQQLGISRKTVQRHIEAFREKHTGEVDP